jgi:hypothetical protein
MRFAPGIQSLVSVAPTIHEKKSGGAQILFATAACGTLRVEVCIRMQDMADFMELTDE